MKANRNEEEVQKHLARLTKAAQTGEENLLAVAVDAARARASLGEISDAIEKVSGRHKAIIRSIQAFTLPTSQMKSKLMK